MRIGFRASNAPAAQQALAELTARHGDVPVQKAEVIVALGGDGFSTAEDTKGSVILVQAQASGSDAGTANSTITNAGTITATFTSRATSTGPGTAGDGGYAVASTISMLPVPTLSPCHA